MHKWELAPTSICECGKIDQIAAEVILVCIVTPKNTIDCLSFKIRLDDGSTTPSRAFEENLPQEASSFPKKRFAISKNLRENKK